MLEPTLWSAGSFRKKLAFCSRCFILQSMKCFPLFLALAVFALVPAGFGDVPQPGKGLNSATVLIIRHAEDPDSGTGLSPTGQQRAVAYVKYFKTFTIDSSPIRIAALYAAADSSASRRSRLTLQPLSQSLGIAISATFKDEKYAGLAAAIRTRPAGQTMIICWHRETIPGLVQALGGDPKQLFPDGLWPHGVFNGTIVLRYDKVGKLIDASYRKQNLMLGDSK